MGRVGQGRDLQGSHMEKLILWVLARPSRRASRRWTDREVEVLPVGRIRVSKLPQWGCGLLPPGHAHCHQAPSWITPATDHSYR